MNRINRAAFTQYAVLAACLGMLLPAPLLHGRQQRSASPPSSGRIVEPPTSSPSTFRHLTPSGHLPDWLAHHQNLPIQQQEMLLRRDPAFNRLPAASQQRLMDQLIRIDTMPPARRQRYLARNEAIERLTPQQHAAFNRSLSQLNALPADRREAVSRAFRSLRQYPPDQRSALLNGPPYSDSLRPEERGILGNLLSVEPYLPPASAQKDPPAGSASSPK